MIDSEDKIKSLPNNPGIYMFKDRTGNVIYLGKALNLRKRVKSYFDKSLIDYRTKNLLKELGKIEYETANSELEALLLEAKFIKQYQPKYNVRLKDDKRYLYVGLSKEKYPRLYLLRQPELSDNLYAWFGPFPTSSSLKEVLRLIRRIFPYRSCRRPPESVCLYYHLHLCPGMCQYRILLREYQENVRKIKLFLEGRIGFLVQKLKEEMRDLSGDLRFEEAEGRKKQIQKIENLLKRYQKLPQEDKIEKQIRWLRRVLIKYHGIDPIVLNRIEAYDVANLGKHLIVGSMVVFENGEPSNTQYRQFKVKSKSGGDPAALKELLERRFRHREWWYPQLILIDGGKSQLTAAYQALNKKALIGQIAFLGLVKESETIVVPVLKQKEIKSWKLLRSGFGKPLLQYARDEAHRFAQRYYKKLHRKKTFNTFGRG